MHEPLITIVGNVFVPGAANYILRDFRTNGSSNRITMSGNTYANGLIDPIANNGAGVVLAGVTNASIVRGVISGNRGDGLSASGGGRRGGDAEHDQGERSPP